MSYKDKIIQTLSRVKSASAREISKLLGKEKDSTIPSILSNLFHRGCIKREKRGGVYIYFVERPFTQLSLDISIEEPYQLKIKSFLDSNYNSYYTCRQIAETLNIPHSQASIICKNLLCLGEIQLAGTKETKYSKSRLYKSNLAPESPLVYLRDSDNLIDKVLHIFERDKDKTWSSSSLIKKFNLKKGNFSSILRSLLLSNKVKIVKIGSGKETEYTYIGSKLKGIEILKNMGTAYGRVDFFMKENNCNNSLYKKLLKGCSYKLLAMKGGLRKVYKKEDLKKVYEKYILINNDNTVNKIAATLLKYLRNNKGTYFTNKELIKNLNLKKHAFLLEEAGKLLQGFVENKGNKLCYPKYSQEKNIEIIYK